MSMFSALRPMAERFMTDHCTINEPSTIEFDADEGVEADTAGAEVYAGVCQVRPFGSDQMVAAGEGSLSLLSLIVRLPWNVTGVELDQIVTVTSSSDPHMVDRRLRVTGVQGGTDAATRNLFCEDIETVTVEEVGS